MIYPRIFICIAEQFVLDVDRWNRSKSVDQSIKKYLYNHIFTAELAESTEQSVFSRGPGEKIATVSVLASSSCGSELVTVCVYVSSSCGQS